MERLYTYLPQELVNFVLVTLFSLLIGLSQRRLNLHRDEKTHFGTDRTFTFIGILGFLLYMLDTATLMPFLAGGGALVFLLGINYFVKMFRHEEYGVTTVIIALITYCMVPVVCTQPSWFYIMVVVVVLLLTELKRTFKEIAERMQRDEMITLAKFLAISGIILPILPDKVLIPGSGLTPYSIWLATVVVSGISYLSYLLKRYVFRDAGVLVSGIIGGMYSSTATISVLARKSKQAPVHELPQYAAAMLASVGVMYIRFLILIGIFSISILEVVYPFLLIMAGVTAFWAWFVSRKGMKVPSSTGEAEEETSNPLEFKVALIFAGLFVLFTFLTQWTLTYAGTGGLNALSVVSGLSDITPFILNLLGNHNAVQLPLVVACIMQAIMSNIIVNLCYAYFFSGRRKELASFLRLGFFSVIGINFLLVIVYHVFS